MCENSDARQKILKIVFIDCVRQAINDYMYHNVCVDCRVVRELRTKYCLDVSVEDLLQNVCTMEIKMFCLLAKILDKLREVD